MRLRWRVTVLGLAALVGPLVGMWTSRASARPTQETGAAPRHWVVSWTASPTDSFVPTDAAGLPVPQVLDDQTLRMVITPHAGGRSLRLHLSNRFGSAPLTLGPVTVGLAHGPAAVDLEAVTFGGRTTFTIPVGADVTSDPVGFTFAPFTPLAVSIYVPGAVHNPTKHWNANATSWYSPPGTGNLTGVASGAAFSLPTEAWLYVDGLDVQAPDTEQAIVAFGDSITDGYVAATPLSQPVSLAVADRNGRYPDDLQRRIDSAGLPLSVVNAGIGSNRLLTDGEPLMMGLSGLQRLHEDALDQAGVTGVILLEGINDLGLPPSPATTAQMIAGYEQAVAMAHAAGKRIWLGTIMPASNAVFDGTLTAPQSEISREQINAWIRSQRLADGVIDFDAVMRDPANPAQLNPAYSGPDHLHPNLLGYQVMADAVDLATLQG